MLQIPIFAYLFFVYPLLFLYTHNIDYITLAEFIECLAFATVAFLLLLLVGSRVLKSSIKANLIIAITILALTLAGPIYHLIYFGLIFAGIEPIGIDYVSAGLLLICTALLIKKVVGRADFGKTAQILNALALSLIALCLINWGSDYYSDRVSEALIDKTMLAESANWPKSEANAALPDIYYIILDAYGRADNIKRLYGYDNAPFINALKERGFYVAERSRANYAETLLSLPTSLNLNYVEHFLYGIDRNQNNRTPLLSLLKNNLLFSKLKETGYQIVTLSSGFHTTDNTNVDRRIQPGVVNSLLHQVLMNFHVPLIRPFFSELLYNIQRERITRSLELLSKPLRANPQPLFVFAHLVSPHPPFIFNHDGSARPNAKDFSFADGDEYGIRSDYAAGYVEQLKFLNGEILKVIDSILKNSGERPIIVIQGDHGPGLKLYWDDYARSDLEERLGILNAYLFPDGDYSHLKDDISPVNSFRIIANQFLATKFELKPDRSFFSSKKRPYLFHEVPAREDTGLN